MVGEGYAVVLKARPEGCAKDPELGDVERELIFHLSFEISHCHCWHAIVVTHQMTDRN